MLAVALQIGLATGVGPAGASERPAPGAAAPSDLERSPGMTLRSDSEAFRAALELVRAEALTKGVTAVTLDRALAGLEPDPEIARLVDNQPEHARTAGDYVTRLVSDARVEAGRAKLAELTATFQSVEAAYGVPRQILAAIWGVETNFGAGMGDRPVVRSLATLAAVEARRSVFWRGELVAALRILQAGDAPPDKLTGSWAGAMGHTQFMPTTLLAHAVDFDRDGRRDMWGDPVDALASAANYLVQSGWAKGEPWGFEVVVPAAFDYAHSAPGQAKTAAQWQALGLARPLGLAWPATGGPLALLLPAGAGGPAFLTSRSFRAILRYNAATSYALAVGHLADRLGGGGPLVTPWPVADVALSRAEREEMQRRLADLGHDTGGVDGILGGKTRVAIRAFQQAKGLPQDGHPSAALLARLRRGD